MRKKRLLFLLPGPIYRPDLPDFKDKYVMLSENFRGMILTWTTEKKFRDYRIGNFIFKPLLRKDGGYATKSLLGIFMVINAYKFHFKQEKFDVVVCYDPIFTGIIGAILKRILKCKLIIEINGNLLEAGFLRKDDLTKIIKRWFYKSLMAFSLNNADLIKLLDKNQKISLRSISNAKKIFHFHDFVPTHYFTNIDNAGERNILFVGYPFYLKGVDILIKAFNAISHKYPDFVLKLVGFQLEREAMRYFSNLNGKIKFYLPVFYDRIKDAFLNCYCFVLPSREESMGRVLLEAMSCAKPVIGADVGGIPEVIEDGENGLLFKKEDHKDLASKLDILLSNPQLAKRMGERGRELIKEKFSSEKYCEHFTEMLKKVVNV